MVDNNIVPARKNDEGDLEPADEPYTINGVTIHPDGTVEAESLDTEEDNNRPQVVNGDDTAADIQAKIDNLSDQRGGPVEFDPQEYILEPIALKNRTRLWGAGIESTLLQLADGQDANFVTFDNDTNTDWFWSEISDLRIDGNKAGNTSGHAIYINNGTSEANDPHIDRVVVFRAPETGLVDTSAWGTHIDHCAFESCGRDGVDIQGGSQYYISNCFSSYNSRRGINVTASNGHLRDTNTRSNGDHGVAINRQRNSISGLYTEANDKVGLIVTGSRNNLENIVARDNGQDTNAADRDGIRISGDENEASGLIAVDTQSTATQYRGVSISGADIDASNIFASGNTDNGVHVTGAGTRTRLSNVQSINNDSYGLAVYGDDTSVFGGYLSGNGFDDIYIGAADVSLWNVQFGSINDGGTRTRYNGIIGGGPLGGTDIGSLTGASAGDVAMADGTSSTNADTLWTLKSSGDWQRVDGGATITPA